MVDTQDKEAKIKQGKALCSGFWTSYEEFGYDRHFSIHAENRDEAEKKADVARNFLESIGIKFGVGENGEFSYNQQDAGYVKIALKEEAYQTLQTALGQNQQIGRK